MLGNLPSHLQYNLKFKHYSIVILSLCANTTVYLKDLPLQALINAGYYSSILHKIKTSGTSENMPIIILEHIILHDNIILYSMLEKYFTPVFINNPQLFTLTFKTVKENDLIFLPTKLLNHLVTKTTLFNNLSRPILTKWFSNALMMNEYDFAFHIISKYPGDIESLFNYIFKGLLANFSSITVWECLNPKSTLKDKWLNLNTPAHFKHFWEQNFPGGIGLYYIKSTVNHCAYSQVPIYEFDVSNFEYYRRYQWNYKTQTKRNEISSKLNKLAYIMEHDLTFTASEKIAAQIQMAFAQDWQKNARLKSLKTDCENIAYIYTFLANNITHTSAPLNNSKTPMAVQAFINSFKSAKSEINLEIEQLKKMDSKIRLLNTSEKDRIQLSRLSAQISSLETKLYYFTKISNKIKKYYTSHHNDKL
jgi:hypothetical protein